MKIESMKTERSGDRCKNRINPSNRPLKPLKIYNLLRERFKDYSFSFLSGNGITVKSFLQDHGAMGEMKPWMSWESPSVLNYQISSGGSWMVFEEYEFGDIICRGRTG